MEHTEYVTRREPWNKGAVQRGVVLSPMSSRVSEGLMLQKSRGPETYMPPDAFRNMVRLLSYMLASSIAS